MTPTESIVITRFVRSACPQQKFDEYTPDAWHKLLGDLSYADVSDAVEILGKRQTFISPAEIRDEVRRIRNERVARQPEDVDYDPADVIGGIETIRAERERLGDGEMPAPKQLYPLRDVAALLGDTAEKMPHVPGSSQATREAFAAALQAKREASGETDV